MNAGQFLHNSGASTLGTYCAQTYPFFQNTETFIHLDCLGGEWVAGVNRPLKEHGEHLRHQVQSMA